VVPWGLLDHPPTIYDECVIPLGVLDSLPLVCQENGMRTKRTNATVATVGLLVPAVLGLCVSIHCLPPIHELPRGSSREGQNWIGQGGWVIPAYIALLLLAVYGAKRIILTRCVRRWTAVYFYCALVMLSLPYIWFLCEPDWFNRNMYRIACWAGGPIAILVVPTISLLVDLFNHGSAKSNTYYVSRSAIEILVIFPIWAFIWAWFSFWILGWGWI
jgi:hypothetical protein